MRVACSEDAGKISFLDQDDVRLPTKMKEQIDAPDTKEESQLLLVVKSDTCPILL
jgi:hypothetical protein